MVLDSRGVTASVLGVLLMKKLLLAGIAALSVLSASAAHAASKRLGDAMRQLGWRRANKARTIKVEGRDVMGFVCGEQPWRLISVMRGKDGQLSVFYDDDDVLR